MKAEPPRPKPDRPRREPPVAPAFRRPRVQQPPDLPEDTTLKRLTTAGTFRLDSVTYKVAGQYGLQHVPVVTDGDALTITNLDGEILADHTRPAPRGQLRRQRPVPRSTPRDPETVTEVLRHHADTALRRAVGGASADALRTCEGVPVAAPTQTDDLSAAFGRFWWGESVSSLGSAVTYLALQTIVLVTLQGGAAQVGWLNSSRWLPYLLLGLVVGALVDRVRRRPLMVVTDLARAGLLGLIPLLWVLDALTFPLLLVVVLLFGTASLVNDAASQSFVPRLVPRRALQRAHARLDGARAVAETAGPALAGALIKVAGAPLAVLVDALSYLFSAAMVASVRGVAEPAALPSERVGARGLGREIRDGTRWAYGRSGLRRLAVATHVWFAGQAVLVVLVVPYGYGRLGLTALQVGLVFAVAGLGAMLGAATSTALGHRLGTGGAIICSYSVSAVGVLVMLGAASAPTGWAGAGILAAGQVCHGWAMGASNSHEMTFRQALTPDELQARTNTTLRSLNRAVIVVVSPVAGLLGDQVGVRPVLACAAVVFGAAALMLAWSPFRHARVD